MHVHRTFVFAACAQSVCNVVIDGVDGALSELVQPVPDDLPDELPFFCMIDAGPVLGAHAIYGRSKYPD